MAELTLDERILSAMSDDHMARCLQYCFYDRVHSPDLSGLVGLNGLTQFEVNTFVDGLIDKTGDEAIPIGNGYDSAKKRSDPSITQKVQRATFSTLSFLAGNWETASSKRYFEDHFSHFLIFLEGVEAVNCQNPLQQLYKEKKLSYRTTFGVLNAMSSLCEISRKGDVNFWTGIYDSSPQNKFSAALALLYIDEPSMAQRFPDFVECCMKLPQDHSKVFALTGFLGRYKKACSLLYNKRLEVVKQKIKDEPYRVDFERSLAKI